MVYFEVTERDGPGRLGLLKVGDNEIKTPSLIDQESELTDKGSLWRKSIERDTEINVLTSKTSPNSVPKDVAEYLSKQNTLKNNQNQDRIYSPVIGGGRWSKLRKKFAEKATDAEMITLESLNSLRLQSDFLNVISEVKEAINENTAVYAPGTATPYNLGFLVYLGIDLFDTSRAIISASRDQYFTERGISKLNELDYLPCNCPICINKEVSDISDKERDKRNRLLKEHNINLIDLEIRKIRNALNKNNIREYIETRVKSDPELTASLRKIDQDYFDYLEKRTPSFKRSHVYANSIESLNRVEMKRFRKRVLNRYVPPETELAVLLPCSAKKPYSLSKTHQIISSVLKNKGNQLIVTSPLGLVPRELELVYPAQHYDLPVIGNWLDEEKEMIKRSIESFFTKNSYEKIIVHINGELKKLIEETFEEIEVEATYTSKKDDPRSSKSLNNLKNELNGFKSINQEKETIGSICDYQFGNNTGKKFVSNSEVRGRFPRLKLFLDQEQAATVTPNYGSLSLTMKGVKEIELGDNYVVKIDEFYPKGSVLSPGVIEADSKIRPNDEVIFYGDKAIGVGRAKMSGFEMMESDRGIAIQTRHVEEK